MILFLRIAQHLFIPEHIFAMVNLSLFSQGLPPAGNRHIILYLTAVSNTFPTKVLVKLVVKPVMCIIIQGNFKTQCGVRILSNFVLQLR